MDIEGGVGLVSGQGGDPLLMLDWSDDGGHTWSSSVQGGMGRLGDYGRRLIFNRLGSSYGRNYRLTISDPVKRVILGARADISQGAS